MEIINRHLNNLGQRLNLNCQVSKGRKKDSALLFSAIKGVSLLPLSVISIFYPFNATIIKTKF